MKSPRISLTLKPGDKPPKEEGFYLTFAREWVFDRPANPSWSVRWFANKKFEKRIVKGDICQLEVVLWAELPGVLENSETNSDPGF